MSTSTVPALVVPAPGPDRGRTGDVRVTVRPGEDVLLPAGLPFGACRPGLAELLRRPELRHVPLRAAGVPVADDDVVGHRPLLPGAVVALHDDVGGATRTDAGAAALPPAAVLDGPWLAARADGPAAGATVALAPGGSTALPDDAGPPSARGVAVRVDPRRPDRVTVRLTGRGPRATARLVRGTAPARRRARAVGRLQRRWRPGTVLQVTGPHGVRSWTLHRSGTVAAWLDAAPGRGEDAETAAPAGPGAGMLATAALPVVGSLGLAAVLRQPAYALFSLLGVATLVPQLLAARRRRRSGTAPSPDGGTSAGHGSGSGDAPPRVVGEAPGPLLARLAAAHPIPPRGGEGGRGRAAKVRACSRPGGPAVRCTGAAR